MIYAVKWNLDNNLQFFYMNSLLSEISGSSRNAKEVARDPRC